MISTFWFRERTWLARASCSGQMDTAFDLTAGIGRSLIGSLEPPETRRVLSFNVRLTRDPWRKLRYRLGLAILLRIRLVGNSVRFSARFPLLPNANCPAGDEIYLPPHHGPSRGAQYVIISAHAPVPTSACAAETTARPQSRAVNRSSSAPARGAHDCRNRNRLPMVERDGPD